MVSKFKVGDCYFWDCYIVQIVEEIKKVDNLVIVMDVSGGDKFIVKYEDLKPLTAKNTTSPELLLPPH